MFVLSANTTIMGFIKHALIGIALYEAVKYFLKDTDVVAVASQNDHYWVKDAEIDLQVGTNPETPLTGPEIVKDQDDPWRNSLANDELRAPDS